MHGRRESTGTGGQRDSRPAKEAVLSLHGWNIVACALRECCCERMPVDRPANVELSQF